MIYVLIVIDLLFLLGIFEIRKERKEHAVMLRGMRSHNNHMSAQMRFLKRMINSSYVLEVLTCIYVVLLTIIVVEYFFN